MNNAHKRREALFQQMKISQGNYFKVNVENCFFFLKKETEGREKEEKQYFVSDSLNYYCLLIYMICVFVLVLF